MGRLLLLVTLTAGLLAMAEPATDARFKLPPPEGRLGRPVAEAGRLRQHPLLEANRLGNPVVEASRLGNAITELAGGPQVATEHFSRVQPGLIGRTQKFTILKMLKNSYLAF